MPNKMTAFWKQDKNKKSDGEVFCMKRLVSSKTETQMKSTLLQVCQISCHISSMRLEPDLVGNPEDLFSHHEIHIKKNYPCNETRTTFIFETDLVSCTAVLARMNIIKH